ncbi:MAG: hypothetical protein AAGD09_17580 [Cyanobacteria bacterium P01_F01_bin.56]
MDVYTADDIKAIVSAPMTVGMAVVLVDMGIVSTAIEAAIMTKEITGAAQKYPHNSIIQAAFSSESLKITQMEKPDVKAEDIKSGAYIDAAIAAVNEVMTLLQDKAPATEITEYKQFIYDCGVAVANAAGSGLFGTGAKVSEAEAQTLAKFKTAFTL